MPPINTLESPMLTIQPKISASSPNQGLENVKLTSSFIPRYFVNSSLNLGVTSGNLSC